MSETSGGGRGKGGLFDDLAGMAGGAFSVLAGLRQEMEAMARAQVEAMVQRLELVRREDLDAALELARRDAGLQRLLPFARAALEAGAGPAGGTVPAAGIAPTDGTVPEGSPAARASVGMPGVTAADMAGADRQGTGGPA